MNVFRKLASLFAALVMAGSMLGFTASSTLACASSVTWWEDANYGGASYTMCYGGNIADFTTIPSPLLDHRCHRYFPVGGNDAFSWNDCVSSFQFVGTCHYEILFFSNVNYNSVGYSAWASVNVSDLGTSGHNDSFSSAKIGYRGTCPSSP